MELYHLFRGGGCPALKGLFVMLGPLEEDIPPWIVWRPLESSLLGRVEVELSCD